MQESPLVVAARRLCGRRHQGSQTSGGEWQAAGECVWGVGVRLVVGCAEHVLGDRECVSVSYE